MADIRQLIIDRAAELGMSPRTLAAIISYETGGTFDPMEKGPTTQWGQHEGLIQFGEPQRAEYGVDMSSPDAALISQLGPGGAVVKYFRKNGWQPGMSDLDAYSIVNAGAPGKYNASDANNGGAPGTVRDKVENQFGGHYANADRLLGGQSDYAGGAASGTYAPDGGIVPRASTSSGGYSGSQGPAGRPQPNPDNQLRQPQLNFAVAGNDVNNFLRQPTVAQYQPLMYERRNILGGI